MTRQILIIDDDADDCDLFNEAVMLVDSGVMLERAQSAKHALALLQTTYKPDLIFLDLNMPMIDGASCLVEIRKILALGKTPVIIYTTSRRVDDEKKTMSLGANYFLTKPSSLNELCAEISFTLLHNWEATFTNG